MKRPNEFKTGILVLGGFAIFIFANIILSGISFSQEGFSIFIRFTSISGISTGSDVRLADGIRIGTVVAIEMKEGQAIVEARIKNGTKLTRGSRGSITSSTFLSELFVSISTGAGLGKPLVGGETIEGEAPMSMVDGIREFGLLMKNVNSMISSGTEGSIIHDIGAIIRNTASRVEQMLIASGTDVSESFRNLNLATQKLNRLADEFSGSGTKIQSLVNSVQADLPAILANLKQSTATLVRISDMAANQNGSVAALLSSRKLYDDITVILDNLKTLSVRLKNDPSIILWRNDNR
jgi:phospholipid/cholesterol/gamma-HCH transport system substrate-binding protein